MLIRDCECLNCKHKFEHEVKISKHTQNTSGEATAWCPKCNSKNTMAGPAYNLNMYDQGEAGQPK